MIIIQTFEHISIERLNELHGVDNCYNCYAYKFGYCNIHKYKIDKPIECDDHKKDLF